MKLLITGTNGYIGNLTARNLSQNHTIYQVIRRLLSSQSNSEQIEWDFNHPFPENQLPETIDGIIHLAQSHQYRDLTQGADDMFNVNVASTYRLLQYALRAKAKLFCYISTGSVYDTSKPILSEGHTGVPSTLLGASKLAAELLLKPFEHLINISVLRLFTPFGPGQNRRMIPELINRVREERPITITGNDNGSVFSTTYIDDVVEVIRCAIGQNWQGTFNVASPSTVNIKQMGEIIGSFLNKNPIFEFQKSVKPINLIADTSRLAEVYNISRMTDFSTGIKKMLCV